MVIATPRTRETGSSANFSVTVPLVSDVPKRRTAEGALDPVPVREHVSANSDRVPLVIGFKWDKHGDRLAPVGDDDPLPLGHPLFATRAGLVQWSEVTGLLTSRTRRSSIAHRPDAESRDSRISRGKEKGTSLISTVGER